MLNIFSASCYDQDVGRPSDALAQPGLHLPTLQHEFRFYKRLRLTTQRKAVKESLFRCKF
jgi:hypothetical protein